jgi:hypothetical protein
MNKRFRFLVPAGAALATMAHQAQAAVPADITSAIGDMKADGIVVATAFVVAIIAVAAIKFLRSAK